MDGFRRPLIALAMAMLLPLTVLALHVGAGSGLPVEPWPPDAQSTTGPTPPSPQILGSERVPSPDAVLIEGVPAYLWHHGCGPTAAGMVIGYWDGHGFGELVAGDASTQTPEVNAMIASEGPASNYTDYCEPLDAWPTLLPDKSEPPPGDEHPDDCVADYMKTSQSARNNYYGWSWFSAVAPALESAVESAGPGYGAMAVAHDWGWDLTWGCFCAEIDAGRPLVFLVDTDGNGSTDHFVTVIGYDDDGGVHSYACLNTWDTSVHWFEFAGIAPGQAWGVYGAVTLRIYGPMSPTLLPLAVLSR